MKYPVILEDRVHDELLFEGNAIIEHDQKKGTKISMKSSDQDVVWKLFEKGCLIETHGEMDIRMILYGNGRGKAELNTPYGLLEIPVHDVRIDRQDDQINLHYHLEGQEEKFHFCLRKKEESERKL